MSVPGKTDQPLISVVIPTHQRAGLLELSLESLTVQTLPHADFEVLVVDDGSTDNTAAVCERLAHELPLRYLRIENSGIAAAKNLGLFTARAPLVLFFDDDDVADRRLLDAHLEAHRAHPDENVVVLGYTAWAPELEITPVMEYVTDIGKLLFAYPNIEDGEMVDYHYFWGGRSSCKRSFLAEHGSFDQDLPAQEDTELAWRLSKHGMSVFYTRAAKSFMIRPVTFDEFARRCVKRGRALWLFASRHDDPEVERHTRVSECLEKWPVLAAALDEKVERVRELEREHVEEGTLTEDSLDELYGLYRWTFEAFQTRGIAEAAAESPRATVPVERVGVLAAAASSPSKPSRLSHVGGDLQRESLSLAPEPAERIRAPVVVFGVPRSGTTYLNRILNAHPDVNISNETRLFVWVQRALDLIDDDQVVFTDRAEFSEYLSRALPDLIRGFYRERWPRETVWGDKNPHYSDPQHRGALELVRELFPGAKFIHVLRDGRDVVASLIRKFHPDGTPWISWEGAHEMWNSHIESGHEFAQEVGAAAIEVRYESLIADDVGIARELFDFLGVDFHPSVQEFCERQQQERTPVSGPTRDLSAGVAGSDWEVVMTTSHEREKSLELLRDNLTRFGYPV
jgi:GT2 family glycosyltransferase